MYLPNIFIAHSVDYLLISMSFPLSSDFQKTYLTRSPCRTCRLLNSCRQFVVNVTSLLAAGGKAVVLRLPLGARVDKHFLSLRSAGVIPERGGGGRGTRVPQAGWLLHRLLDSRLILSCTFDLRPSLPLFSDYTCTPCWKHAVRVVYCARCARSDTRESACLW
jgi:hypothetical protein